VSASNITPRTFIILESNKRRKLSIADIAEALAMSNRFDFLSTSCQGMADRSQ
ncbi:hypothetical protein PAXRUDRAFT_160267, partial [Paxillus rubicundulus Ve08.2h10]